jgi:hypothetical protein
MEEDLINNFIEDNSNNFDMSSYVEDEDGLESVSSIAEETKQFLDFIQAVKDDNIEFIKELSKEAEKISKCKIFD